MPVELPVAPIPSQDPKKKKEKSGDEESKPTAEKDAQEGKPTDEEELVSRPVYIFKVYTHHEFSLKRIRH